MTALDVLRGVNAYPIPASTLTCILESRGLTPTDECDPSSREVRLSMADAYAWLAIAPNISQGGQTYSFSSDERKGLRQAAQAIYSEQEEIRKPVYGYKGSRL